MFLFSLIRTVLFSLFRSISSTINPTGNFLLMLKSFTCIHLSSARLIFFVVVVSISLYFSGPYYSITVHEITDYASHTTPNPTSINLFILHASFQLGPVYRHGT